MIPELIYAGPGIIGETAVDDPQAIADHKASKERRGSVVSLV
jgi:hypothetical protein